MNALKFLFIQVLEKLKADVADIKYIDLWNSQPFQEANERAYDLPAAFMEIPPVLWEQRGGQYREANVDFIIHIQFSEVGAETDGDTPVADRSYGLQRFEWMDDIAAALVDYEDFDGETQFGKIIQIGTTPDNNTSQTGTDQLLFRCRVKDPGSKQVKTEGTVASVHLSKA